MSSSQNNDQPTGLPEGFDVPRPQRGAKEGYYYDFSVMKQAYLKVIVNMDGGYDPRLRRIIRTMIASVVDDNLRLKLWNMIDATDHYIDHDPDLSDTHDRNLLKMDIGDIIIGEIQAFYDQFVGVTHRLKVGNARAPDILDRLQRWVAQQDTVTKDDLLRELASLQKIAEAEDKEMNVSIEAPGGL